MRVWLDHQQRGRLIIRPYISINQGTLLNLSAFICADMGIPPY